MRILLLIILTGRVNRYGLPIVPSMFKIASEIVNADYYGYLNADIIFDPTLFDVLHFCKAEANAGRISRKVSSLYPFSRSTRSLAAYTSGSGRTFPPTFQIYCPFSPILRNSRAIVIPSAISAALLFLFSFFMTRTTSFSHRKPYL